MTKKLNYLTFCVICLIASCENIMNHLVHVRHLLRLCILQRHPCLLPWHRFRKCILCEDAVLVGFIFIANFCNGRSFLTSNKCIFLCVFYRKITSCNVTSFKLHQVHNITIKHLCSLVYHLDNLIPDFFLSVYIFLKKKRQSATDSTNYECRIRNLIFTAAY